MKDYKSELMIYLKTNKLCEEFYNDNINVFYFTFIWNLFENICCCRNANNQALEKLSQELTYGDNDAPINDFYDYLKLGYNSAQRDSFYLNNRNYTFKLGRTQWLIVKDVMESNNPVSQDKVEVLLYISYRIRNNLFHGEKDPRCLSNQNELFKLANEFLLYIIKKVQPNFDSCYY